MRQAEDALTAYRETFPSDTFLQKHFGENIVVEGNPNRGEISEELYPSLRRLFDGVLRSMPKHILSVSDGSDSIHVFRDGVAAPWVDPELERRRLMIELSPTAFLELCREFIHHCQAGPFLGDEWWRWQTDGDSIWVEKIAGVTRQRRTLADVLGEAQT